MGEHPVILRFRGLPPSAALHALVERHARRLQESAPGLGLHGLQATVERREWPSRAPTVQVLLQVDSDAGPLRASAGDFGRSNGFLAMEAAFAQLRSRLPAARTPAAATLHAA
jgi:hypothetical protein